MANFLAWFNSDIDLDSAVGPAIDPFVKAGIAHLWFVTIHPFEDGNGRISRAIADMALARADQMSERFYSMSAQIETERKQYYAQLESQQRNSTDITPWLDWFLDCLGRALEATEATLATVRYKSALWNIAKEKGLNERQQLILNRMLNGFKGYMNTSKYAKIAKCSTDTALRDIQNLLSHGLLIQNPGGGRSTSYRLPAVEDLTSKDFRSENLRNENLKG